MQKALAALKAASFHPAERFLVGALLVFGLAVCFLLPVGGGYDEETHLMRVWEMSALKFIPNQSLGKDLPFPAVYWDMSYRRPFLVRAVDPGFFAEYRGLALDARDYIYGEVETRSVYSPPLLLPQALVMRYFGRSWQFPALTVFYLCRLAGLFSYLVLVWAAVRVIPFGKWLMALLAVAPVAVLQAATVSADSISNGLAFLFIAGTLALAARPALYHRDWVLLALLFLLLFWGKLNLVPLALLPFLLLRPAQFKVRGGYILLLLTVMLLFVVEVAGWNALAYARLSTPPAGTDPLGQVRYMLTHPAQAALVLLGNTIVNSPGYLRDWLAIYGFNYWPVPVVTFYLYAAGLITALCLRPEATPDRRTRLSLLAVFAVTYLFTVLSLYLTFNPVASPVIDGVQGRYFLTVMPLLFLALACLPFTSRIQPSARVSATLAVLGLCAYAGGMFLSYHVPCGSQFYQPGLCYQPNYKNWAPDLRYSAPLSNSLTLRQEIVPECNQMTELRVWVNASAANPRGTTRFSLVDVGRNQELAGGSVSNATLPAGGWYAVHFEPISDSSGRYYLLTLTNAAPDETPGVQVAYALRQEYPAGKLFENDAPVDTDVLFQTGCLAGWSQ